VELVTTTEVASATTTNQFKISPVDASSRHSTSWDEDRIRDVPSPGMDPPQRRM